MPARKTDNTNTRGFTFTEILIVVVIVMIMGAMIVPMFQQTTATQLSSAASLVAADLAYAQTESIAHGDDPRIVVFTAGGAGYHIAKLSDPSTPITGDAGMPYSVTFGRGRAAALKDVSIQSTDCGPDSRLGFLMYGQLDQTAAATITLAAGPSKIKITLDPTSGEAKIGQFE